MKIARGGREIITPIDNNQRLSTANVNVVGSTRKHFLRNKVLLDMPKSLTAVSKNDDVSGQDNEP